MLTWKALSVTLFGAFWPPAFGVFPPVGARQTNRKLVDLRDSSNTAAWLKGSFNQVESIVRLDSFFCALTVDAKNGPERQAIGAHPFLRKAAG